MTLAQVVDVSNRADAQLIDARPRPLSAARLRETAAIAFVGVGLLATLAWIALLGWLLYRAVFVLGVG